VTMSATSQSMVRPISDEDATPAPRTPSAVETRFAQRLPQFITMFFSFTMVGFFKTFTDTFHFTTGPAIDLGNGSQDLVMVAFLATLFWIVTAWLGYSVLIERYPYTADLGRFFFDVARFALLNFQMNFTFLAGQISSFQVYIFGLALWHLLMVGWYAARSNQVPKTEHRAEARRDIASHGIRCGTYLALGLIYYLAVAGRASQPDAMVLRYVVAGITFVLMTVWNLQRVIELRTRVVATA
jgi:hypothetical protein